MNGTNYIADRFSRKNIPQYDTYDYTAAAQATLIEFFARTESANGIRVTNLAKANEMTPPGRFIVKAIRAVFLKAAAADIESWLNNYRLTLRAGPGKTPLAQGMLDYFPGGAGVAGAATTTATTTTLQAWANGLADPRAICVLPVEIEIQGGEFFQVVLEGTTITPSATGVLRIYLDGYKDEGVRV